MLYVTTKMYLADIHCASTWYLVLIVLFIISCFNFDLDVKFSAPLTEGLIILVRAYF